MAQFQPISEAALKRAQAKADKNSSPFAVSARFRRTDHKIALVLSTGLEMAFDADCSPHLEGASDDDLSKVSVFGGGTTLAFPTLDIFLTVSDLLEGFLGPMEWARRDRRAAASRENGKRGGRPPKAAAARALEEVAV